MRPITLFRAMAWLGVALVFWSLNVQWGSNADAGAGPPAMWHRTVVGAGLLSFIAAMAMSLSGRKDRPPSWLARAIAGIGAAAILFIAYRLRMQAEGPLADTVRGQGWTWLVAGGGLVASAVVGSLGIKAAPARPAGKGSRKPRKS